MNYELLAILIAFTTFFTIVLICFVATIKYLKNDIKTLDRHEGYANDENNKLSVRIDKLESDLYVVDYLVDIGESSGSKSILKSEAVSFEKIGCKCCNNITLEWCISKLYTTKENYKNHKPLIDKLTEELKGYNKLINK